MHDFTLLALPGAFASGVSATLDLLACAAAQAHARGCAAIRWRVCGPARSVTLSNGVRVEAELLPRQPQADRSIWVVPGLCVDTPQAIDARLAQPDARRAMRALQAQVAAGGTVAACCSAVFLLQGAGLLAGKRVTTTWWLGGLLQQLEPTCVVDVDQMVVADGSVLTAGAAFANVDLLLHLLRSRFNPALAEAVSRTLLVDGRQSQAPYIAARTLAAGNDLASRLVARFEARLAEPPSVAELAAELCMSSRTLARHVKAATGRSVSALLQSVRIQRARMLLETSTLSVEEVARQVGYADTTALRRLLRKSTRATPRQLRPQLCEARR
ncbi:helix-turn-helix domain-containing protein [Pseudomonas entomophila]|uniref:GlxA family transcriptional regulator n=1 Tax=Pseudomonas entomophila TaxID=312306 RepID=UPI0023D7D0F1|nr:helix-turn-helix domain-containing protein [Pseudomonas entomophila]MDF0731963.1 helix-turn-helix domain-containing protein [Pseudomonas entomophila]